MKHLLVAVTVTTLVLAGCGDDTDESTSTDPATNDAAEANDDDSGTGDAQTDEGSTDAIVDPAPPGQATASVDGLEFTLELVGGLPCSISDDAITFSYRIGDNEVVVGGGANPVDGGWIGNIELRVADPTTEPGPVTYFPAADETGVLGSEFVTVSGAAMSYSGPMLKQPANDGSNPPPVDVGTGTISATCG